MTDEWMKGWVEKMREWIDRPKNEKTMLMKELWMNEQKVIHEWMNEKE